MISPEKTPLTKENKILTRDEVGAWKEYDEAAREIENQKDNLLD